MSTLSVPDHVPPVSEDCKNIHKALQGSFLVGADGKTIVSILAHRNTEQRHSICEAYAELYEEVLPNELEKKLSSAFQRAVLLWTRHPPELDAMLAYKAVMNKKSEAYFVIMEIGCIRTSRELYEVRQDYLDRCKRSLEEDIASRTSEDIRKLLVPLVTSHRYKPHGNEITIDTEQVKSEAKILHEVISHKDYSHDELIRILATRSKPQLRATLQSYYEQFGNPINKDLKENPKDEYIVLLRATIKCLTCPEKYFEKALRLSMKGCGTDEETLTRVVVTRAEADMKQIKEEYQKKNNVSLADAIKGDTSGDYMRILLALVIDHH